MELWVVIARRVDGAVAVLLRVVVLRRQMLLRLLLVLVLVLLRHGERVVPQLVGETRGAWSVVQRHGVGWRRWSAAAGGLRGGHHHVWRRLRWARRLVITDYCRALAGTRRSTRTWDSPLIKIAKLNKAEQGVERGIGIGIGIGIRMPKSRCRPCNPERGPPQQRKQSSTPVQ